MNGISPLNYRPVTPEKERRVMLVLYAFFLGFGLIGAIMYPVWSYLQHVQMTPDGWVVVLILGVMALAAGWQFFKEAGQLPSASIENRSGIVSLTLGKPTRIGNVIEVEIEAADGSEPNVLFVTDNAGNTFTAVRPGLWRALNYVYTTITVTIQFNPGVNLEFRVKEWGEDE
jgi:hypothetical protein